VKHWHVPLALLAALSTSVTLAEDFKTISRKEYKNATVSRVEPDDIVLRTKSGISKVYFVELPKEVQERFHYDAAKANAHSAQQIATITGASKPAISLDATKPLPTSDIQAASLRNKSTTSVEQLHRIGATCRGGSDSSAVGRGACSRHGGVRCWKYSDGTCH
jgi:hypothetical protein